MALSTGRMKLYNSLKTLRVHWERTLDVWNDSVSQEFDEKVWKPLDSQVQTVLRENDRLAQVLAKMHNDCS